MDTNTRFFPLRYAVSHGALPALVLGTLADFGTPVGLHWFSWFLAALYLLALALFITRPGARQTAYDLLCAPEEARRTPFLVNPFAWALIVGASIAGLGGVLSYLSREEGGFLAANVQMLREVQTTNLLLTRSIEVQEEISGKLDDVKRETSDNPAKELANMGFDMSPDGIKSAIDLGKVEAVHLFADAGTTVSAASFSFNQSFVREEFNPLWGVISRGNVPMAEAISRLGTAKDAELCLASPGYGRGAAAILVTAEAQKAYRLLCAGGLAESQLRAQWQEREALRRDFPERIAACKREATQFLQKGHDPNQIQKLSMNHAMKIAGSDPGELQVDEATASVAFNGGGMALRSNGSEAEYFFSGQNRAVVLAEACDQVLNPDHPAKLSTTQDEDLKVMLAALRD